MIRSIVQIDEEKCDGCGQCVPACAEGAIQIIDGKARLVSEVYCDGLGACLGECPQGAITMEEREADPFDEAATKEHVSQAAEAAEPLPCGCPGSMVMQIEPRAAAAAAAPNPSQPQASALRNWPVQLKLAPTNAPYFQDADLLLVADCVPFAMGDFHPRILRGRPVIVGCPKLDDPAFYADKLTELLRQSSVRSLTVVHMEVPCCSGLSNLAQVALDASGRDIPLKDVTVGIAGDVIAAIPPSPLEERELSLAASAKG